MGQRLAAFTVCVLAITVSASSADQSGRSSTSQEVLGYFTPHTDKTIDAFLSTMRPAPLDAVARRQIIASLPKDGELRLSRSEIQKIAAAERILDYSARKGVITVKVIDLNHGFVGLYERTVLLASRFALALVSDEEFAALVAHEVAHEYVWAAYSAAKQRLDHPTMQRIELQCDGIAVLMLRRIGIDPERLVSAVQKVTRFNEWRRATVSAVDYVPLKERIAFIQTIANLAWQEADTRTGAIAEPK